jgi:hypothetical protein
MLAISACFVNKQTTFPMNEDFQITVYNAQDVAESADMFYIFIILEVIPQAMPHQNTKHCKFSINALFPENSVSQLTSFNQHICSTEKRR